MTSRSKRAGSRFKITRSLYFWPLCILVGPQCISWAARAFVVVAAGATVSSAPLESAAGEPETYDITECQEESKDCHNYCVYQYGEGPRAEKQECDLLCDEIYDKCVYEKSGGSDQGCDEDDAETAGTIACAVLYGISQVECDGVLLEACLEADCAAGDGSVGGSSDALYEGEYEGDFEDEREDGVDDLDGNLDENLDGGLEEKLEDNLEGDELDAEVPDELADERADDSAGGDDLDPSAAPLDMPDYDA